MRKWLPSTKLLIAVGALILSNILLTVGENQDLFANVPDPWRTLITVALTAATGYMVKERNLTAAQLHGKP